MRLDINVVDDDSSFFGGVSDLIDVYSQLITQIPDTNSSVAITHSYSVFGTRATNPTTYVYTSFN